MRAQKRRQELSDIAAVGDISAFVDLFERCALPEASVTVDRPDDPMGEWWLDITTDGFSTSVAWRPALGFGLFTSEPGYGDRPDKVVRTPEEACNMLVRMRSATLVQSH